MKEFDHLACRQDDLPERIEQVAWQRLANR